MTETKTPWPEKIDGEINLHGTTDATVWAQEFCKRYASAVCQIEGHEGVTQGDDFMDTMRGWFANAIMTGVDHANWVNGIAPNTSLPYPDDTEGNPGND